MVLSLISKKAYYLLLVVVSNMCFGKEVCDNCELLYNEHNGYNYIQCALKERFVFNTLKAFEKTKVLAIMSDSCVSGVPCIECALNRPGTSYCNSTKIFSKFTHNEKTART